MTAHGPVGPASFTVSAGEVIHDPIDVVIAVSERGRRTLPSRLNGAWSTYEVLDYGRPIPGNGAVLQVTFGPGDRFELGAFSGWGFGRVTGRYSVHAFSSDEAFSLRLSAYSVDLPGTRRDRVRVPSNQGRSSRSRYEYTDPYTVVAASISEETGLRLSFNQGELEIRLARPANLGAHTDDSNILDSALTAPSASEDGTEGGVDEGVAPGATDPGADEGTETEPSPEEDA